MRLVATEYLSLDGVFQEPGQWSGPWFNDEAGAFKFKELLAADALLLGRRTYEGFAAAWPTMPNTGEFGEKMNSMPKYVVTSTQDKLDWAGSKPITGKVAEEVQKLKDQPGNDLLLSGSGRLFNAMMEENLIDLYRFMLYPVSLGKGTRLFTDGTDRRALDLTNIRQLSSGVVILEYAPAQ